MSTADDSLYWACFYGYKHRILELANENNVKYVHPQFGDTPLHQACKQGWLDIVEILIEAYSCDPNVVTKSDLNLLHCACRCGHIDEVTLLIERYGCDPNVVTNSGESLLHYAYRYGHIHIVMLLIEKYGCDFNVVGNNDKSLLHYACQYGHIYIVKLLIEKYGCDPNVVTKNNQNLLHFACRYGHIDIVKYLINKKYLNPFMKDNVNYLEALDYAVNNNRNSIAVYLCQNCISSDELLSPNRIKTIINLIKYIISTYSTWACSNKGRIYPMWRTANDQANILQLVGSSKMHIAHIPSAVVSETLSSNNAMCIVAYFEPDLQTADGDTILQLILQSISNIYSWMLAKLLSNSTKITITEMKNVNPKWKTLDRAHFPHVLCLSNIEDDKLTELMQYYILENGWNPNTFDGRRNTILHIACQTDKVALVSYLIDQAQCDPNIENSEGSLPVDMATSLEAISYLCQHDQVSVPLKTINKWLNNPLLIDDKTMLYILRSLVNSHKYLAKDGSTLFLMVCACSNSTSHDGKYLVDCLLTDCKCDPNCIDSKGQMPLQLTSDLRIIKALIDHGAKLTADAVLKVISSVETNMGIPEPGAIKLFTLSSGKGTMLWRPTDSNKNGETALDLAYTLNKPGIVNYLLKEAKRNYPPAKFNGILNSLLKLETNLKFAKLLIRHGARVTPELVLTFEAMETEPNNKRALIELMLTTWDPNDRDSDGYTALHLACKAERPATVNLLLSVTHCDPNVKSKNEEVPIQLTFSLNIMKTLIEHGAQMTTDIVFKLIFNTKLIRSRVNELFQISIRKETMLMNPNDMNSDGYTVLHLASEVDSSIIVNYLLSIAHCDSNIKGSIDGYTALHLACKADRPATVNLLLSVGNCDPNIKSKNEEVPLQMTTNPEIIKDLIRHGAKTSIMYKSYKKALGTNKPLQPPVKVFVVGNPSVGKSTLTAALKTERGIIAQFFSSGKVSGVDEKTVGIVPHDLESGHFGRVTLYDFAGHREFYSGHAALLQTAIQSTPPIFLLVVKLSEDDDKIIKNILYWIQFLENQCASVTCRPHIILVGSHADALKEVNPKDKVKSIISTLDTKCFTNMECIGSVAMNCQLHESTGMNDLRRLLIKSCQELRIKEPITFNAHCFLIYLIDKFINVTAVTIKNVSETIKFNNQQSKGVLEFLPTNIDTLYKICLELNDRGHILLLKDRITVENSYVVIDKEFLLSKISGTVFAPEGFKQYKDLSSNTGVVPLSKIAHCFPDSDTNILIAFLTHLEFCHEISDQNLLRQISKDHCQALNSKERYYLFPGLISSEAESDVWETVSHLNIHFGWTLQCTNLEQFLTSRFLQVLLLRLAFSLASKSECDGSDAIGIHRKCSIWKNGIFWGREFGMETLVEVIDDKAVLVISRFQTSNLEKCLKHRSEVICTVLECHNRFCPRVSVAESFIDVSSPLKYPFSLSSNNRPCAVHDLSQALVSSCESPLVVMSGSGKTIPAERFLSFEPYAEIDPLTLQELWNKNNENKIISNFFLLKFVKKASSKLNWFAYLLSDSATLPSSMDELYHELLKWKDNKMTYKQFRQKLDQYSVFTGRNVLVSVTKLIQNLLTHYVHY